MNLKRSLIIASVVIILVVVLIITFKLSFSGVYVASWVFSLLFGAATTHFFRFEAIKKVKLFSGNGRNDTYFSVFNLILLLIIAIGFILLVKNIATNQSFNVIHVSVILYGTGLLIGNNYKGFEY